ncbi:MAG: 2-oxo acid dehydrogenase subunit E2 [Desulfohalobiaceae bacterium]|nr:2-oxo acid dehydrogenase subunit E2 [Desulfohalobiaceae bacterium]
MSCRGDFHHHQPGGWDIDQFTPINNFPESAILGLGRIIDKPWVRGDRLGSVKESYQSLGRIIDKPWVRAGAVVAEPRLALSLTFDHRIIDGALGAEFLKGLKDMLEETRLML